MRYLRQQIINRRSPSDSRIKVDMTDSIVMDTVNNMLMPKGASSDRPVSPVNGMMRYNTETNQFEGYQAGAWRNFRFKEPGKMEVFPIGTGNAVETKFALNFDPFTITPQSGMPWDAGQIAKNLIVVVENVFQIATVNYTIEQNPSSGPGAPYPVGVYVVFGTPVPLSKPIYVLTGFDQ